MPKKFNDHPFPYHHELELDITSLTNQGHGVGRVDGWVVMVPFALPGERVRARVYRNHKNYSEADLVEVLKPSPHRVEPGCPLFGTCGGCQYQNLAYEEQLAWKQRQVQELLQRMAGIETAVEEVIPSPVQYGYRSKITPHFQKPREGEIPAIGFLATGSRRRIVDVPQCPISVPEINEALPALRESVFQNAAKYRRGATLLIRHTSEGVTTDHKSVVTEQVGEFRFRFPAGDFFQNNPFILPSLTDHVGRQAKGEGIRFLVDAYCGSGLFCITGARHFESAAGIEISETSIDWARTNARENSVENCTFHAGDAASIFEAIDFPGAETAVIIDPPRRGSDEAFLTQLFAFRPRRVVYVSCNPATQIRDLKAFLAHGYNIQRVQPFDLFPQTKHLECVVTLDAET